MADENLTREDLMRQLEEMTLKLAESEAALRESERLRDESFAALKEKLGLDAYNAWVESQEEVNTEVEPIPIVISTPPPFYVKAIPDDLVKDSLVFKCGALAKWHVNDEVIDTTSPPLYTEVKEEIHVFVYGGEGVKGGHARRKKSLDERGPSAKCFERSCPMRRVLNEWVDEWSVHSGRFKLLG